MATPVHGNPQRDKEATELNDKLNAVVTDEFLNNLSLNLLRVLFVTFGCIAVRIASYCFIRMSQKLGGHIGADRARQLNNDD